MQEHLHCSYCGSVISQGNYWKVITAEKAANPYASMPSFFTCSHCVERERFPKESILKFKI